MTYVARTSAETNERLQEEDIQEFNAQLTSYADRGTNGYYYNSVTGKGQDSISVQEFATLYNTIREWNSNNPSDTITFSITPKPNISICPSNRNINTYLANGTKTAEELFAEYFGGDTTQYYFTLQSSGIRYNNKTR